MPDMTPQQLFDLLVKELSASGSEPILDNDGKKMTLRQAVARILWKENFLLPLNDRPVDPKKKDDQYGHVLSTHAIALQNQAILADLAGALGRDVPELLAQVKASITS